MATFAIVDVANLFYRARHGARGDAFTKVGLALHIVFRSLKRLHREFNVDHMVFAVEGRSWRYEIYPEYKAKRRLDRAALKGRDLEEEEIFTATMTDFVGFLREKTKCTVLQRQGIEGDDFIARWIQLHPNDQHIIVSGDSDFVQLLAENVRIYDGMNERLISIDGILDPKGNYLQFSVDTSSGKLKVGDKAPAGFKPEPEWWKKALFIKLVRGDPGDGIFSAYPGVRYEGSSKRIGIREAWEDRQNRGYAWNNFMLQTWSKIIGKDENGNKLTEEVRVADEFARNQMLIDLTKQPQHIIEAMDAAIVEALQAEREGNVAFNFLKFCGKHDLPKLAQEVQYHAAYLDAAYKDI